MDQRKTKEQEDGSKQAELHELTAKAIVITAVLLSPGKAAHDTRPAKEPQEAHEPDDGEPGSCEEEELEEPGLASGGILEEEMLVSG